MFNRDADVDSRCVDTPSSEEGGTNCQSSVDIHPVPPVKQIASGKLLYITGSSARGSWMT